MVLRTSSAHEEGGERLFGVSTSRFIGEAGKVVALELDEVKFVDGSFQVVPDTRRTLPAELVLLALGFVGPEKGSWLDQLGVGFDSRGNVSRSDEYQTDVDNVFVAGDMGRGQSLIVWAIAEGRACAAAVDEFLMGESALPSPVRASDRPLA
jgi:glutamate synthase (NADPH/NADH) small chain